MTYVEPVYTRSAGSTSFPILRRVIVIVGNSKPVFAKTLAGALHQESVLPFVTPRGHP